MKYEHFDFNTDNIIKKIVNIADATLPRRTWNISTVHWQDTDFMIEVCSGWGNYKDVFAYKKSEGEFITHSKQSLGTIYEMNLIKKWEIKNNKLIESK